MDNSVLSDNIGLDDTDIIDKDVSILERDSKAGTRIACELTSVNEFGRVTQETGDGVFLHFELAVDCVIGECKDDHCRGLAQLLLQALLIDCVAEDFELESVESVEQRGREGKKPFRRYNISSVRSIRQRMDV